MMSSSEAANNNNNTITLTSAPDNPNNPNNSNNNNPNNNEFLSDDEDLLEDDEADAEQIKPWDEGGASHCGYSDAVHSTLMSVGATVHQVVGHPGEEISKVQHSIGNWFQELSYAARDIVRGENTADMHEDAADAVKTLMSGGKNTKDEQDGDGDPAAATSSAEQTKENTLIGGTSGGAAAAPVDP